MPKYLSNYSFWMIIGGLIFDTKGKAIIEGVKSLKSWLVLEFVKVFPHFDLEASFFEMIRIRQHWNEFLNSLSEIFFCFLFLFKEF